MIGLRVIRDYILKTVRYLASFSKPELPKRKPGVSAFVVSRNEPFLELSIKSIKDKVDEIILVDASTGEWKKAVDRVAKNEDIKLIRIPANYKKQTKRALRETSYKWILRWDADFIAFPELEEAIEMIKKEDDFMVFVLRVFNLELDFFHYDPEFMLHGEGYLFRYSDKLFEQASVFLRFLAWFFRRRRKSRVKGLPRRIGYSPFPLWYKRRIFNDIVALHMRTIKPIRRVVEKKFQPVWTLLPDLEREKFNNDLTEYVNKNCNPIKIYEEIVQELKPKLKTYDGEYPESLRKWISNEFGLKPNESPELKNAVFNYVNRNSKLNLKELNKKKEEVI